MPLSKKESNQKYKAKLIQKYGSEEAYREAMRIKKSEYRQKKRELKEKQKEVEKQNEIDVSNISKSLMQLSQKVKQGDINITIKEIPKMVDKAIRKIELKQFEKLSEAIFITKTKYLKSYKRNTHDNTMKRLMHLGKCIKPDFKLDKDDFQIFKGSDMIIKFIEDKWSNVNTRLGYVNSLVSILKYIGGFEDAYEAYLKYSMNTRMKKEIDDGKLKLSSKERKLWIKWPILSKLTDNKALDSKTRAIVGLYTLIPPRRLGLIKWLKYGTGKDINFNYLNLRENKIILNMYKTYTTYGQYVISIPDKLKQILKEYIKEYKIQFGKPLFPNSKGDFYSNYVSSVVSKAFEKASGKRITVNIIRHSYVVEQLKHKRTINEKKAIARSLGHSLSMLSIYDRLDIPE